MEIDSSPVPPPQEYSNAASSVSFEQRSYADNLDYLQRLSAEQASDMNTDTTYQPGDDAATECHFAAASFSVASVGHVDDSRVVASTLNLNEKFVSILDEVDARVETLRKEALGLQEQRDYLLISLDLIKSNDLLETMSMSDREEIEYYIHRVNSRLATVELNVRTIRDSSQEDSLSQINGLIDMMIIIGDPALSRQRCQMYLNSCCSFAEANKNLSSFPEHVHVDIDAGPVDKRFESALLGCTLDDQKNIKKRLQALMSYLNRQTIHNI